MCDLDKQCVYAVPAVLLRLKSSEGKWVQREGRGYTCMHPCLIEILNSDAPAPSRPAGTRHTRGSSSSPPPSLTNLSTFSIHLIPSSNMAPTAGAFFRSASRACKPGVLRRRVGRTRPPSGYASSVEIDEWPPFFHPCSNGDHQSGDVLSGYPDDGKWWMDGLKGDAGGAADHR